MAQIRATWSEDWTEPRGASAQTTFRLVMTNTAGTEYAIERARTDAAGGQSWIPVTTLTPTDTLPVTVLNAGISPHILAGMLGVLLGKRRA